MKRVQGATAEDLQAAANRCHSDGVYIPEVHPLPDYNPATTRAVRPKPPSTAPPPALRLPKLLKATLSNGLKVILAQRHEVPLVTFWLDVDAGYAADPSALPGTSSMTMALLNGGTKTRNALQISDEQALLGA